MSSRFAKGEEGSLSAKPKVALGMSGGVDSSLAAHLLVEQGYDVTGIYLECWRAPGCRTDQDRKDALAVALQLNIPYQVLDFKEAYRQNVVEYFFAEAAAGRTPNPDVMCNREIKFGLFYDWAMANGFDYVATGHYAALSSMKEGSATPMLTIPKDQHKDQTYFLYQLRSEQLNHILFPLGGLLKSEVRAEAKKRGIPVADKKDSVGICFIGDIDVGEFLRERLGENPGDVIDVHGNVIGKHDGLWFYTIGQRHGFTIFPKTMQRQPDGSVVDKHNIPPFYVIGKKPKNNQLVVGFGVQSLADHFFVSALHELRPTAEWAGDSHLYVRIRHTGELHPVTLYRHSDQTWQVTPEHPLQGVATGQSAVFYLQDADDQKKFVCVGGGVIENEE